MSPWIKRIAAALAIKEGIERVQEMRQPKRSFWSRLSKPLTLAAIGGGIAYLYKAGKLDPIIGQAKERLGGEELPARGGNGEWTAPAGTAGATSVGAASTTSSV